MNSFCTKIVTIFITVTLFMLSANAIEIVLDGQIVSSKTVPAEIKPTNFKNYDTNIPYYVYNNSSVVVGYNEKAIAKLAMDTIYSREDQYASIALPLSNSSKEDFHIMVISDVATPADAQKLLPNGQLIGEAFNIVDNKGTVLKQQCYLVVAKKSSFNSSNIANALDGIYTAIAGAGL